MDGRRVHARAPATSVGHPRACRRAVAPAREERETTRRRARPATAVGSGRVSLAPTFRFSAMVSMGKTFAVWGTRLRPRRVSLSGRTPLTSSPASSTRPAASGSSPYAALSRVVFPAPFGPMIETISSRFASRLTPRTTSASSYPASTFWSAKSGRLMTQPLRAASRGTRPRPERRVEHRREIHGR